MAGSIIEEQRMYHERSERLTQAAVKEILHPKNSKRDRIDSDTRMKKLIEMDRENRLKLKRSYDDVEKERESEIVSLSTESEFSRRLDLIKKRRMEDPGEIIDPMCAEFKRMDDSRTAGDELVKFSGEEGYGKFLDLNECYNHFINLKDVTTVNYLTYVRNFDNFTDIPKDRKIRERYKSYLVLLLSYLEGFVSRIKPLLKMAKHSEETAELFEKDWADGNCPGWPKETSGALAHTGAYLDLNSFSSWEELASLGLDRLKSALIAMNLKCGGSLEERAKRLFSCKGKNPDEIDKSLYVDSKSIKEKESNMSKGIAFLEAKIRRMAEFLKEEKIATEENIQRKQASSHEERTSNEIEEQEEDESEEEEVLTRYNPKNVPTNADGSVMDFWLYKLRELDKKFNCEICGNHTYNGPYEYEKHFSGPKHAHGMRVLKIPNTSHFANVTLIEDAKNLWHRMQMAKELEKWKGDEEEFEDSRGNVVKKKVFEDLMRQRLL